MSILVGYSLSSVLCEYLFDVFRIDFTLFLDFELVHLLGPSFQVTFFLGYFLLRDW